MNFASLKAYERFTQPEWVIRIGGTFSFLFIELGGAHFLGYNEKIYKMFKGKIVFSCKNMVTMYH